MGDGRVDVSMIFAGVSLLISALAVPLALGRIGPNAFYGVRLQATLADRRVWFEVNRIIGRELVCVGVLLALIAGLGGLFLDLQPVVYARLYTILTLALLAGILVRALAVTTRSEMSQVDDSDGSAESGS
jgi:uncharacterized membrane protein